MVGVGCLREALASFLIQSYTLKMMFMRMCDQENQDVHLSGVKGRSMRLKEKPQKRGKEKKEVQCL